MCPFIYKEKRHMIPKHVRECSKKNIDQTSSHCTKKSAAKKTKTKTMCPFIYKEKRHMIPKHVRECSKKNIDQTSPE
jgi:hypothetical protein